MAGQISARLPNLSETVQHTILFIKFYSNSFTGNYNDSLSDAKVATDLQPSYVNAIVRGRISKSNEHQ